MDVKEIHVTLKHDMTLIDIAGCIFFLLHAFRLCQWLFSAVLASMVLFNKSAYRNETMEPLWKQASSGFESYCRNAAAQGYFKTQNYPDKTGQKVIMDKCCSWCLKPFDKLDRIFALMGTWVAAWQVQHVAFRILDTAPQFCFWERWIWKAKCFSWLVIHVFTGPVFASRIH